MWDGRDCQGLSAKGKFLGELVCLCAWAHCEDKGCLSGDRSKSPKVNLQIDQTSCCALIYLAVRWEALHSTPQRFFTALKLTNGCTLLHARTPSSLWPGTHLEEHPESPIKLMCKWLPLHKTSEEAEEMRHKGGHSWPGTPWYDAGTWWVLVSGNWEVSPGPQLTCLLFLKLRTTKWGSELQKLQRFSSIKSMDHFIFSPEAENTTCLYI